MGRRDALWVSGRLGWGAARCTAMTCEVIDPQDPSVGVIDRGQLRMAVAYGGGVASPVWSAGSEQCRYPGRIELPTLKGVFSPS